MNQADTIHIACEADDNYVPHTAAMLHSLWWYNRSVEFVVHFLHGPELSYDLRDRLGRMTDKLGFELRWVEVQDELTRDLAGISYIPKVVWYRVFMPQLLSDLDRVLYIDGDVVAADSITPLWQTRLGDNYFAAVTNAVPEYYSERAAELGLPGPEYYFNAGIALWNLSVMRREGFTERVINYWRDNRSRLLWLEQDVVNALYYDKRIFLHPRWNCQNGIYFSSWGVRLLDKKEVQEAKERPALIHFEGGAWAKPWHFLSTHPMRKRYYFHRRRTPWPLFITEGITLRNMAKKYIPDSILQVLRQWRS